METALWLFPRKKIVKQEKLPGFSTFKLQKVKITYLLIGEAYFHSQSPRRNQTGKENRVGLQKEEFSHHFMIHFKKGTAALM